MESNYWDKKASDYDNHLKKSEMAYIKVIELIKLEINKAQTVLDIGTGTGEIPIAISDNVGKIIATDYSQEMINVANLKLNKLKINNITFQAQDCTKLSFGDEMFDSIIASNLLHLLKEPSQFMNSLSRLLKKEGKLIIPTFLHNESVKTKIISKILALKGHPIQTKFNASSLIEFVEKNGYTIEKTVLIQNIMPLLFVVVTKRDLVVKNRTNETL
jgi:ubiquinone/menaquinone biosynthesis C-methylase UbiE